MHCFCVCSGSVLLGDLLGVSRSKERDLLSVILILLLKIYVQIRASFFDAVSTLCSKCPSVATEFCDQMCPAVLYLLDETEPVPMTSLWRAVLHVIVTVPVRLRSLQ